MDSKGLAAIVLRKNPNLAWAIGGRVHVPTAIDAACFDLIITPTKISAVTNVIEAPRLIAEEFPPEIEVTAIPWWEGRDSHLPTGSSIGSDQAGGERVDISLDCEIARSSLTEFDGNRLEEISISTAKALGQVMKSVESQDREIDVAGKISQALWSLDLEIAFLGVAGEKRSKLFRHPLPTSEQIGDRVVASICAKRKGLIASVTRIVSFRPWTELDESEYQGILNVEAAMLAATTIGSAFSGPVLSASHSYGRNGFDLEEWHRHHQGGPTGYLPRDWPATLSSQRLIASNQAVAWNPTGKGWKAEDTWLTKSTGPQLLSFDPDWPAIEVDGRLRPKVFLK